MTKQTHENETREKVSDKEINDQNGWVMLGIEESIRDLDKFVVGTNPKVTKKIEDTLKALQLAFNLVREAYKLKQEESYSSNYA